MADSSLRRLTGRGADNEQSEIYMNADETIEQFQLDSKHEGGYDGHLDGDSTADVEISGYEKADSNAPVTFKSDPTKVIDYVLVYDASKSDNVKDAMRTDFEEDLNDFGMEVERELSDKDCFVLIHCPFEALCRGAELMKLKKPTKKAPVELKNQSGCCRCCQGNKKKTKLQIYQAFTLSRISDFQLEDESSFFTSGERNYIVYSLLEKVVYKNKDVLYTGLGSILGQKGYTAAYPLHDPLPDHPTRNADLMNNRELLLHAWANLRNTTRSQPLNEIKNYFGEQFSFYFAWMGLYTTFLFVATLGGLACFIYGVVSLFLSEFDSNIPMKEICDSSKSPGNFIICPKCNIRCNFSILSDSCNYSKFTQVFDNEATLACAVFICVWATCYLEFWKRKQLYLQHIWNVVGFEADENIRPQYYAQTDSLVKNPLSGKEEPTVSFLCKGARCCASLSFIFFLLTAVLAAIFSVLVYRLVVAYALYQSPNDFVKENAKLITTFTAGLLNVVVISVLGVVYKAIAKVLTDLEAHKTRTSYEDSFIFKMVVFQFINNYGSIIYIAFFKGSFMDKPGQDSLYMFHTYRQDQCDDSGCFSELTVQLIIIMIGKQLLNAVFELITPLVMKCIRSRDNKDKTQYKQWEKDFDLESHPTVSMFGEYLEMVIQYGFVVMFAAAFPLAPLFAFINNIFEIRLDAYKMIKLFRRPAALKAQDIGAWQGCISTFSYIAVITNAFIIAWTSDFIPEQVYKWNHNGSLHGYVSWSLATFNVSELAPNYKPDQDKFKNTANITECKYRTYSPPAYQIEDYFVPYYWQILCARWAFVIVFENLCFLLMHLVQLIPDESEEVKLRQQHEKALTSNINLINLFDSVRHRRKDLNNASSILLQDFGNAVQ